MTKRQGKHSNEYSTSAGPFSLFCQDTKKPKPTMLSRPPTLPTSTGQAANAASSELFKYLRPLRAGLATVARHMFFLTFPKPPQ